MIIEKETKQLELMYRKRIERFYRVSISESEVGIKDENEKNDS